MRIPTSHKIALLSAFAVALIALRYVTDMIATTGGLAATITVICAALIAARLIES